ncbi:MAG: succinate dehydrogenase [Nitrososphaerota archaeon]|nr:succinate dehydrogenase [Nitrososphaerota archaeon]MDG6974379.1 succinate dehydrogenase [Nitrososphaerota archaeon]MDG6974571.1 succinate dehydrogenase [Nitrososphaerota archaeon]MDG7009419.1 succinate dehydrogenase [Nitrososphaerota archaeon]MDG7019161.1 succinate dehydrogenase [Nitrososphaerota archaeon]
MRESRLMLLQYVTALLAVALVSIHLMMQGVILPYDTAISFNNMLSIYRNAVTAVFLEALLLVVLVHGFNGLRIILYELRQTKPWTTWVDVVTVAAVIGTVAYGTRTVILAAFGVVSA